MIVDQSKKQSATAAKLAMLMRTFAVLTALLIGSTVSAQNLTSVPGVKVGGKIPSIAQLKETVPVYSRPTVLSEDVVIAASKAFNASIGTGKDIQISGTLLYQACDDHQCFLPVDLPVRWVVHVQPFDLTRSPEALQHRE